MNDAVTVLCINTTDPHMAAIFVGPVFVGAFPLRDYERLQAAFNLPPFPCTETFDG